MDIPFLRLLLPALWVLQVGALGQDAKPGRVPWTTSRITGTPEPPPPYRAEVAFPKLVFDRPLLLEAVPGTDRLIVGEVDGSLLTFLNRPDTSVKDVAIELASNGRPCVALYGLAFHPRFEENRQVFLFYVMQNDIEDGTRISRFTMPRTDPPTIDSASEEILLTFRSGGHNGGYLAFGNDGYLYISTGDAEVPSPPDPRDTGQDVGDLLSSILRIDVDRRDPGLNYRIPPDNPFRKTSGARPEVWAYGFRNPWRMSFDRKTGGKHGPAGARKIDREHVPPRGDPLEDRRP